MINRELYIPQPVEIDSVRKETNLVKTFRLKAHIDFLPGQFLQVSILGMGEAPISISSSPLEKRFIELTIRKAGKLTNAIYDMRPGDFLWIRGPYGRALPVKEMEGKNLIFAAGGIGIAALRSFIMYAMGNSKKYGHKHLFYSAKRNDMMVFQKDLNKWQKEDGFDVLLSLYIGPKGEKGNVGVITSLLERSNLHLSNYAAIVCGPPRMIRYTVHELVKLGLYDRNIFINLERHMKCGVGKCGHCYLADKYACTDGPIFSYKELKKMKAAESEISEHGFPKDYSGSRRA